MKLVLVEWADSKRMSDGWIYNNEVKPSVCVNKSVGWILESTKDILVIAPHRGINEETNYGAISIPKCAIKRIFKVEKKKVKKVK
ncbi:MAG: hypothetical protein A2020_12175 [Lentisphaerae bacterium GWF2_45_14]|nr:MAG: hypothetical protein A2020_12175 [Lentisphaerae bacterium GWF2_45_14]